MAKEFSAYEIAAMAAKYQHPVSYYENFHEFQATKAELPQTLHTRGTFLSANAEQKEVYSQIVSLFNENKQHLVVLEGPSGSGKSFLGAMVAKHAKNDKQDYIECSHFPGSACLYTTLSIYNHRIDIDRIPALPIFFKTRNRIKKTRLIIIDELIGKYYFILTIENKTLIQSLIGCYF